MSGFERLDRLSLPREAAQRIAANIVKLPTMLCKMSALRYLSA